jgi:hypothetical protein
MCGYNRLSVKNSFHYNGSDIVFKPAIDFEKICDTSQNRILSGKTGHSDHCAAGSQFRGHNDHLSFPPCAESDTVTTAKVDPVLNVEHRVERSGTSGRPVHAFFNFHVP